MNKNHTRPPRALFALLAFAVFAFVGCGTPTQNIATAHFLAGNSFATRELGKNPASVTALEDLAKALPDMASGKVSPFQMGVLNAELQEIRSAAQDPALERDASALIRIGSLMSAAIQANAGLTGGNPTATTAVISANLTDFANGITHGIAFWRGQQSVRPTSAFTREEYPAYVLR